MTNPSRTNQDLLKEISCLQKRIQELEKAEADRKQVEEALRESEEKYRLLVENAVEAIFVAQDHKLRFVNNKTEELIGYKKEQLISKPFTDFIHPDDRPLVLDRYIKRQQGAELPSKYSFRVVHRTGKILWVELNAVVIFWEQRIATLNFLIDITERRRSEQEITTLADIGRVIGSTLNIDDVYEQFASLTRQLIPFDTLSVNLIDLRQNLFHVAYLSGLGLPGRKAGCDIPLTGTMTEYVLRRQKAKIFEASSTEDMVSQYPEISKILSIQSGFHSNMLIPLFSNDAIIGVLHFRARKHNAYTDAGISLAERIGMQIAGAITNAQMFKNLGKAEDSLRKQANKLSSIFRAAPVGIGMVINRVIQEANDTLCQMTGYSLEELLGRDARMLYPTQEDYDYVGQEKYRQIDENRIGTVETRWKRKDGKIIDIILSSTPLDPDDLAKGVTFTALDITERKRAEKTLQRQNIYLESLNETALGLMRRTDLKDLFQAILDRAMRFFGTDEGWIFIYHFQDGVFEYKAAMGKRKYEIGLRVEADSGISTEVRRTEQTVLVDDYHVWPKRANGREYDMRRATVAIPLRYEGQLAGILGLSYHDAAKRFEDGDLAMLERLAELASIALDNAQLYDRMKLELAERKQAEEENLRLVERLQRAEKMEALGQLAGGVAHDLNNVLGILSGYSELLLLEIPEGHRSRGHAEKILQSTEKGAAIIQDLLTLARRSVIVSEVINLNNIVSCFLKAPVFEKMKDYHPRVTFRTECDKNLLNIKGSPVHLEKTLMNLVSNAAESISGKGEVTIRTESRYLDKTIQGYDEVKEGDYAVLTVSDTGIGIPVENREKIFEPFYTKKAMGRSGTGLGLAIVWGTVKDHNGYIDVQSEVGRGTTFTLYFPVTREEAISQSQKAPMEQYMGKGESVLVVDDIAEQRDVAAELLTRLGYEVHLVSSGEEAIEYLKGNKADILVLDMIMPPGMDGLETYEKVLEINPIQKAIIVSGFSETNRVKKAQKLGAGDYVKKPYMMEKIGVALRKELDKK